MPRFAAALVLLACCSTSLGSQGVPGGRDPVYTADGRLALSVRGDLWIVSPEGAWTRVTSGPDWDREPAWSRDGKTLLFSSNRSGGGGGGFDIWQIAVGGVNGGAPTRVVGTTE